MAGVETCYPTQAMCTASRLNQSDDLKVIVGDCVAAPTVSCATGEQGDLQCYTDGAKCEMAQKFVSDVVTTYGPPRPCAGR